MTIKFDENGYGLRLGNGQGWHIVCTGEARTELDRLASLIEIEPCKQNGYPGIFVFQDDTIHPMAPEEMCFANKNFEGLSVEGWRVYHIGSHLRGLKRDLWYHKDTEDVICVLGHEQDYNPLNPYKMGFVLTPIFHRVIDTGGLLMHSALVERDGCGVLLAASGNTGKSTCCRRIPPPWHALSDDESLIVRDARGQYLAHPLPTWSECLSGGVLYHSVTYNDTFLFPQYSF